MTHSLSRALTISCKALTMAFLLCSAVVPALTHAAEEYRGNRLQENAFAQVAASKDYALGLNRYQLDHRTKVLGWRISNAWYFGRQRGADSGLTFVWQGNQDQVSISKDGLRFTRRF